MKLGIKCLIALIIVAMTPFCVSASDTTTKFQTGPFTVTVDLGVPCTDVNISKPESSELLSGDKYTDYDVNMCNVYLSFTRYDKPLLDVTSVMAKEGVERTLMMNGCDKDVISLNSREINKMPGIVGEGYNSELGRTLYMARYYISSYTFGDIQIWDNETRMISVLKTIHVTEAA